MKITYWIFTTLLVLLMLFSAVTSFFPNPDGEAMMKAIGYPYNILQFLAVLKILGATVLLVPGFPRLKEWAYAGFTFDLAGAIYAFLVIGTPIVDIAFLILGLVLVLGSYFSYHKLQKEKLA